MSREDGVPFDTLFVADPFRQWYGAGAGDAAADNGRGLPSSEYRERIGSLARGYRRPGRTAQLAIKFLSWNFERLCGDNK